MKFRKWIAAVVAGTMIATGSITPAQADTRTIIWVASHVEFDPEHFYLDSAINFLNYHTRTYRLARGACVNGPTRCINIYYSHLGPNQYGLAYPPMATASGYVKVDPDARNLHYKARYALMTHELGHTRHLGHNDFCNSVMYRWVYCPNGSHVPMVFSTAEKNHLLSY